ncbi:MAG: hypothetical protein NZ911_00830 [Sulfolobales archaeon]|nr:hypothetical protein [Sulfolobales archaeon]
MRGVSSVRRLSPYIKYPFIVSLHDHLRRLYGSDIPLTYILEYGNQRDIERAVIRVRSALKNLRYEPTNSEDVELSSFYIGLTISSILGRWYLYKYVDVESRRSYEYLLGDSEDVIVKVAKSFGIDLEFLGSPRDVCGERVIIGYDNLTSKPKVHCFQFRMPITTYLTGISKLTTERKWKLVNQYIKEGYVYLSKKEVSRLLQEFIKHRLLNLIPDLSGIRLEGSINEAIIKLREEVPIQTSDSSESYKQSLKVGDQIVEAAHPPCIRSMILALQRNENLAHHQRFALATYFINIGADVEQVVDLFRHAPDFNEKMTRYQVEHLAGLKGSKRRYSMYSCDKMKSLGMCVAECGVKNPLTYYKRLLRDLSRNDRKEPTA